MARHRKGLGARKHVRVDLHKPGFLIPAPESPWIECLIVDVSDSGVSLEVGALVVPELSGLAFTAGGEVLRVCSLAWRRGELARACRHLSQASAQTRCSPARKLHAVFS